MYRDAGALPYRPFFRRPAWIFRCIAVVLGATLAATGLLFCVIVLFAAIAAARTTDALVLLTLAPLCTFGTIYGADLARRAWIALSTDRSAFDGRHGKKRAIVAGAFGGYAIVWASSAACALDRIEPGIGVLLTIVATVGALCVGAFVHAARRRSRSTPSPIADA